MGQTPSIPTDLSRELRVIGAGFSRTGTVSLAIALERLLEGPVMHSGTASLMREEAFIKSWISILQPTATRSQIHSTLRELHAGYVATTDNPAIEFTSELCTLYPKALVICSTRDPASWWESSSKLNSKAMLWWLDVLLYIVPTLRYFGQFRRGMGMRLEKIYGRPRSEMDGPQLLQIHEDYVRSVVPEERLFFYNVKDGWEPLCKILNVPVPDEEFPKANDSNSMQEFFEGVVKDALMRWLVLLGCLIMVALVYGFVVSGGGGWMMLWG